MGGKSGGDAKQKVTKYYMSMHVGVCHSGVDAVTGLYYGEKAMWEGEQSGPGVINIDKYGLFGAVRKEGGCAGSVFVLPGDQDQVIPAAIAQKFGDDTIDEEGNNICPAFRGILSLFFCTHEDWDGTYPPEDIEKPSDEDDEGGASTFFGFVFRVNFQIGAVDTDGPGDFDGPSLTIGLYSGADLANATQAAQLVHSSAWAGEGNPPAVSRLFISSSSGVQPHDGFTGQKDYQVLVDTESGDVQFWDEESPFESFTIDPGEFGAFVNATQGNPTNDASAEIVPDVSSSVFPAGVIAYDGTNGP